MRVEVAGAGLELSARASRSSIARTVGRLLSGPSYRDGAARLALDIQRETAAQTAIVELEALARQRTSSTIAA